MSYRIFISYSTSDLELVNELVKHLQDPSVEVFVAEYSINPGEKLNDSIIRAIKSCDHFVLLWSKNARSSEYVSQEIALALNNDKNILPIVLDKGSQLPGFIKDLKFLPAYMGLKESLKWVQNYLTDTAKKSERERAWIILVLAVGSIILFTRD